MKKTGLAVKSHSGARSKLHELIHNGLPFDGGIAKFLQDGFITKQRVDYFECSKTAWKIGAVRSLGADTWTYSLLLKYGSDRKQ